jgi:pre-mRNA-splicing factor ATP-dependent RNA helicase DHX15/PRP43
MQAVAIHPSSVVDYKPEFCLYHEIVLTTKNWIRTVTGIKPEWLLEIQPVYFKPSQIKVMETRKELERVEKDMIEKQKRSEGKKDRKFYFHDS